MSVCSSVAKTGCDLSMKGKRTMYNMVLDICRKDLNLKDFEECSSYFKNLIYLFRQMNYSEWKSAQFEDFRLQIESLVNSKLS